MLQDTLIYFIKMLHSNVHLLHILLGLLVCQSGYRRHLNVLFYLKPFIITTKHGSITHCARLSIFVTFFLFLFSVYFIFDLNSLANYGHTRPCFSIMHLLKQKTKPHFMKNFNYKVLRCQLMTFGYWLKINVELFLAKETCGQVGYGVDFLTPN